MGKSQSKTNKETTEKLIAIFDYDKKNKDELSFFKNDEILNLNRVNMNYLWGKNVRTNRVGLVNSEMVLRMDSIEAKPWFFGRYSRLAAEMQLIYGNNSNGTFLIRESESNDLNYTLSILYVELKTKSVKHYKIIKQGKNFYLNPKKKFKSLDDLVAYYSKGIKGLCCSLTQPCEKIIKKPIDNLEVKINDVLIDKNSIVCKNQETFKGYLKRDIECILKLAKYCTSKKVLNEIDNLKKIDNKNIIRLIGTSITFPYVLACMESMPLNNLDTYLKNNNYMSKQIIVKIAKQISSAMVYLIDKYIVHRDIRCKNILVGNCYFVKLANFGLARSLDLNKQYIVKCDVKEALSIKWTAPEVLKVSEKSNFRIFTEKSDIWSFGVFLYELFTREEPYKDMTDELLIKKLSSEQYRLPNPQPYYNEKTEIFYNNVIMKCWLKCMLLRPTFADMYNILFNYFDVYEPGYNFPEPTTENHLNYCYKDEIIEENCDQVNLGVLLQSGNYSEIWKSNFRTDDNIVIVKKFKTLVGNQKELEIHINKFLHEYKVLKELKHPNIIKLLGVCSVNQFYLIMDYMKNGSLDNFLTVGQGSKLSYSQTIRIAEEISNGMMYLECLKIVHGDLAARNILVGEHNETSNRYPVKIADFELAHILNDSNEKLVPLKTKVEIAPRWAAPELVIGQNNNRVYSSRSDVYSFGMVLYELITKGNTPFRDINNDDLCEKVFQKKYVMKKPDGICTEDYYNIMKSCWSFDPEKRPKFSVLYQWFSKYYEEIERDKLIGNRTKNVTPVITNESIMNRILPIRSRSNSYEVTRL